MVRNKKIVRLVFTISIFILLASCNKGNHEKLAGSNEYYTCSMDPQVIENKEGICPICHMELIKVQKNNLHTGQIQLSKQQIKLANISYDTLRIQELAKEITLTGKVTVDQNLASAISARVNGRIEKLAIKNVGDYITKGQFIYEIYSEDLNNAQEEYLLSLQANGLINGLGNLSKNKLLLFGMTEAQISRLKISKEVSPIVSIYAPSSGYVSEISVAEGNYVSEGSTLFRLATLNSLWVETQVYLPYMQYISLGTDANFLIEAAGENLFSGKVIFIDPQVQSPERYILARFKITNPSQQIKPGMLANISLMTEKKMAYALPLNSICQDSKGANVWVRKSNGIFENRMVTVGMQNSRLVEIASGLVKGDIVVVTGAYLLNSEYIFKRGANPMDEMKH